MLSKFFGKDSRPETGKAVAAPEKAKAAEGSAIDNELVGARWTPTQASKAPENVDPKTRTLEQRKNDSLAVVDTYHHRIANTIRTMWGYPECSVYINKLIMAGGDGMGHNRVGFNGEAVQAMLELADLHDQEFGASDVGGGLGMGMGPLTPRS